MKKYHVIIISLCFLLSSCISVTYLGDRLTPTSSVDIYYSAHDVTRQYKVIGHLNCPNSSQKFVKAQFTAYAKKVGADAIVITGTDPIKNDQAAVANADALKYTN